MKTDLNILLIEDSETDAFLIMRELGKIGKESLFERVDNAVDLNKALEKKEWDLIISDYSMPGFDGITAAKMIREKDVDLPVIIVSGTIGEDVAVEAMKYGATDYIMKNNLRRLNTAVIRELRDYEVKKEAKLAKKKLKESEELYKTLVETSPDAVILIMPSGKIVYANYQTVLLTAYPSLNDIIGRNISDFILPEDIPVAFNNIKKVVEYQKLESKEYRIQQKNGNIKFVEVNVSVLKGENYESSRLLIIARDVTERKASEDALRLFRTLIEQSNDTIEVIDPGTLRLLDMNAKSYQVLGYTREEMLSLTVGDIDPQLSSPELKEVGEELQKKGYAIFESIHKKKDGTTFPVEVNLRLVHVEDDYVVAICRDITERKQAEEKIKKLNRVYAVISGINKSILRSKCREELFNEACRIGTEIGNYTLVWIGIIDKDLKQVKPVACNGPAVRYLEGINSSIEAVPEGSGLTGRAVREGRYVINNEIPCDEKMEPWISKIKQFNLLSGASFPLRNNGEIIGAITFYSTDSSVFDESEVNLLKELSSDLSYAISFMNQEQLRLRAEEALKEKERHLRQILENVDAVFYMLSHNTGEVIYINSAYERIWERSLAKVLNNPNEWLEAVHPADRKLAEELFTQQSGETEYRIILPDGNVKWIWDRMFPVYDDKDNIIYVCGMAADITERKVTVEKIKLVAHALESINECITITDMADNLKFVNSAFCRTYKYSYNELIGKNISIIRSSNNPVEIISAIMPKTLEGGWTGELINKRKGGEEFPVHLSTSLVCDEKENIIGLLGVSTDITERKKAEEKIIYSELQFRSVWENSADGMRLTNEDGIIILVNNVFCKQVGLIKEELEGNPISIIYEGNKHNHIISQHKKRFQSRSVETHIEKKMRLWNGKEVWFEITNSFLEFKAAPTLLLGIFRDITERKKIEEKIMDSEIQFRSVWENSFDGMRLCNENGKIIKVNEAFCNMMKKKKEEIEGEPYDCIYLDREEMHLEKFKHNFATRSVGSKLETEINLWNNSNIWVELSNSFIDIKDNPPLLLSIFRDITKRKDYESGLLNAKNKAEEMNRMKTNFLNNMSHEMRTPLVAILGYSEFLLSEIKNPDLRDMLNGITSGGQRLLETINSILDLSRIDTKKLDLNFAEIDLYKATCEVIEGMNELAEKKNLYLKLAKNAGNVICLLDSKAFAKIVENLVGNAIKYTKSGGVAVEIDREISKKGNTAVLRVIDTGIGIPKESVKIIFDEFRQVSEGLSRRFEGSGIGLTITKKYVELMGGTITVESQLDKGSKFTVAFNEITPAPKKRKDKMKNDKTEPLTRNERHTGILSKRNKILVVEDDIYSRDVVRLCLKDLYEIDFAEKGEKAVQMTENKAYDAILMDINLGIGMSGIEAAKQIRKIEGYKDIPIIAVTAYAMEGDREKFLSNGCSHYLSKPYDKKAMVKLLNEALPAV